MIQWRVYLEDGSAFDNTQGGPSDAPATGVLGINQALHCGHHETEWLRGRNYVGENGLTLLEQAEWYWWREDTQSWFAGNLIGFLDQAMHCDARFLKQGRYVSHAVWEKAIGRMTSDPDFHGR